MTRTIKRVFDFKRFAFFVTAVCLFVSMTLILLSLEKKTVLAYKGEQYYILTSLSAYSSYTEAQTERNVQVLMGNPSVIFPYTNSYFVCYEVYFSYNSAAIALKKHKENGRILSILYVEYDKAEFVVDRANAEEFKKLYAFKNSLLLRTARVLDGLERGSISFALAALSISSIENDFFDATLKIELNEDFVLSQLQTAYLVVRHDLESDLNYKSFDEKRQLNYLKLMFSIGFKIIY